MSNAYLIEAHRPSETWAQTRLACAKTAAEAAIVVENLGLVIDRIIAISEGCFFNMRAHNPRLLDPWVLESKPSSLPSGAVIPETSPLYRK